MILSEKGRQYKESVIAALWDQPQEVEFPLCGSLGIEVKLYRGDARAYDLDNCLKGLFDALEHAGIFDDDGLIDHIVLDRGSIDRDNPRAELRIFQMQEVTDDQEYLCDQGGPIR